MTFDIINLRASVCYSIEWFGSTRRTISRPSSANLVLYAPLYTPNESLPRCPGENKDLYTNMLAIYLLIFNILSMLQGLRRGAQCSLLLLDVIIL